MIDFNPKFFLLKSRMRLVVPLCVEIFNSRHTFHKTVMHDGGFYDSTGAIRDIDQNSTPWEIWDTACELLNLTPEHFRGSNGKQRKLAFALMEQDDMHAHDIVWTPHHKTVKQIEKGELCSCNGPKWTCKSCENKKRGTIKKDKIVMDVDQKTTVPEDWPDRFRDARCKHDLYSCPACSK